jgi:phosphoserine phosphatase RsbU/P
MPPCARHASFAKEPCKPPAKAAVRFRERSELLDFCWKFPPPPPRRSISTACWPTSRRSSAACCLRSVRHPALYEKRPDLRIRYAVGHREEVVRNLSIALGEGITGTAAARREPVLVGDVRNDPRYLQRRRRRAHRTGRPMIARGKLVGVIDLQSTRINAYSEYDRACCA